MDDSLSSDHAQRRKAAVKLGSSSPRGTGRHGGAKQQQHAHHQQSQQFDCSLEDICRNVIVANLERYSPSVFAACFEDDWENILRLRHLKTKPKDGSGGLDGSGRVAPAISDKVLMQIELENPHLAECNVADELVWHDCVEYTFRRDGLTRPRALYLPWPLLLEQVEQLAEKLQTTVANMVQNTQRRMCLPDSEVIGDMQHLNALGALVDDMLELPMNVSLLHATGIGKTVNKALKKLKKTEFLIDHEAIPKLDQLFRTWKELACDDDNDKKPSPKKAKGTPVTAAAAHVKSTNTKQAESVDLDLAEKCSNWRELFHALKQREKDRREAQGKRMRERRRKLDSGRPKVVKVRPVTAKQQRILSSPAERRAAARGVLPSASSLSAAGANTKLGKIRREASILSSRSKASPPRAAVARGGNSPTKRGASFGDAVAFVSGTKQKRPQTRTLKRVDLSGGRVMAVPRTARGSGAGVRAAATAATGASGGLRQKLGSKFPKLKR